jgi:hypothetical protein
LENFEKNKFKIWEEEVIEPGKMDPIHSWQREFAQVKKEIEDRKPEQERRKIE